MKKVSIYIHWPYCKSKCTYCAFNKYTIPSIGQPHQRMEESLMKELSSSLPEDYASDKTIKSVYFGGGTPSLARPSMVSNILRFLKKNYNFDGDAEITLEANPTSIESGKTYKFKEAGINRVSIGVQSLDDNQLKYLGRDHSSEQALAAIKNASKVFPDKMSLDFIWGLPNQTADQWEKSLEKICSLGASHLSLYQLVYERGTPIFKLKDELAPMDERAVDLWNVTRKVTSKFHFTQYEVSSFCRGTNNIGIHNSSYWNGQDYIGVGPGAHGRITTPQGRLRTFRIASPEKWMAQCEERGHGMNKTQLLTKETIFEELIVFGLRNADGINQEQFFNISGMKLEDYFGSNEDIGMLIEQGYLEWTRNTSQHGKGLRATVDKGFIVLDSIIKKILL